MSFWLPCIWLPDAPAYEDKSDANHITKSLWLLVSSVVICCLIYPLVVWVIGQTFFPFTANGSMVNGPDGKPVGSLLIAQPFTKDEYFQPRPSAASYDASASASSTLAASNYLLRDRVAQRSDRSSSTRADPKRVNWWRPTSKRGSSRIVRWATAHRRAVGRCSQRAGAGMGQRRSHARTVR